MDPSLFRYVWRHSKREQLVILTVILLSLPFYFASFDVPKRIISDALQGKAFASGNAVVTFFQFDVPLPVFLGGPISVFSGFEVNQLQLLFGLSAVFLLLVVINGAFKYYINLSKGILGERLLRRLSFDLFAQYLRFKPEDIRAVKPAEAASIIKDEVEPIGGFTGDAFIQPAFLGTQALTALIFIMVQSMWLGLVALSIVLVQAFVIPYLRREQLRLTQLRQIESRKLAGRIGEVIETAPAIHAGGSGFYVKADLGGRLGTLFNIRVDLFRRKFAVKYLNNLLAQITPFFFYSIGGYLALTGAMSIGQLVAVIAAYRDLPPPIKDLIDWDQGRADVTVKYQQIIAQFPTVLMAAEIEDAAVKPPAAGSSIAINALKVVDRRGTLLLESITLELQRPVHVALVGGSGSGRDILARVLGRQISEYKGSVIADGVKWRDMPDQVASQFLGYVGPDPLLSSGTLRQNVITPILRQPPLAFFAPVAADNIDEIKRRAEAQRSGNPVPLISDEWLDFKAANLADASEVDSAVMDVLARVGMADDVYRFGLLGRIDPQSESDAIARIPAARETIFAKLEQRSLLKIVEPLHPDRYNHNATISENLLFGVPLSERLSDSEVGADPYVRSILEAESLLFPLVQIGLRMAEAVIEIFVDLPPGHPLFERFSFIRSDEMPEFIKLVEFVGAQGGVTRLSLQGQSRLIQLAMSYIEPRHRMDMVNPQFERRVLRVRQSFKQYLPQSYATDIEFYDPTRYLHAASIRDNLLFGRISYGVANAEARVYDVIKGSLQEIGLDGLIHRLGLAYDVGPSGKLLTSQQRASVALARGLIMRPDVLVLDAALSAFGRQEAATVMTSIREIMAGKTLVATMSPSDEADGFDMTVEFDGTKLKTQQAKSTSSDHAPAVNGDEHGLDQLPSNAWNC